MELQKSENSQLILERELLAPYTHLLQVKGKQWRMKIPLAFNHWLKVPDDKVHEVVNTVNMLHTGSLLLDDIQDDAKFRRGIPAAHHVFGVPLTINAVCHVLCLVHERAYKLKPEANKIIMEEFLYAVRGQGWEIYWRDNFICPSEEDYYRMVQGKSGGMFAMTVKMLQLLSDNKADYSNLATLIGGYFQIRDDYCNLTNQEALEEWPSSEDKGTYNKDNTSIYDDITEGKFSLAIIHGSKTSEGKEILNILRKRTEDIDLKRSCVALLEKAGSLEYTRNKLDEWDQQIRAEIAQLGGNPLLEAELDEMLSWRS